MTSSLATKPRWDKYDPYVGNYRGVLAADIDLTEEANVVLAVGHDSNGAVVIGAGVTGIKGVMIIPVGQDIYGNILDGGINIHAGDPCDVGKHGEITNFQPTALTNSYLLTVTVGSGNANVNLDGSPVSFAFNAANTAVKSALVAVDDSLDATEISVAGTAPNFVVTLPEGHTLTAGAGTTVAPAASSTPVAGANYYGHADGSVSSVKGTDGVYIGHTAESTRLIVNVLDYVPTS